MGGAELETLLGHVTDVGFVPEPDRLMLQKGRALAEALIAHAVLVTQLVRLGSHLLLGDEVHAQEEAALTRGPRVRLLFHVNPLTHDEV